MASPKRPLKAAEEVFYLTRKQHIREAERLAWVIDDVLQDPKADRTLADLVAIARLHLDLAAVNSREAITGTAGDAAIEGK